MSVKTFDWSKEIEQVVTKNLITTFGLDFLFIKDKEGGDVDTIHNVRKGIYATEKEQIKYVEHKKAYNKGDAYRQHEKYTSRGMADNELQQSGKLKDVYRNGEPIGPGDKRDLDHITPAITIHNDPGAVLSGLDLVALANEDFNLASTDRHINRSKNSKSNNEFIDNLEQTKKIRKSTIEKLESELQSMPKGTPQQKQMYLEKQDKIRKEKKKLSTLEQINKKKMKQMGKESREKINKKINEHYYFLDPEHKFLKSSSAAAGIAGIKMGMRESIGLVLAEIWFELKQTVPMIYARYKKVEFTIKGFLNDLKRISLNILKRVGTRFTDILKAFGESFASGLLSSLTTTILNIFLTTAKFWGKIIREAWLNIVRLVKLVFFNPENLSAGQLAKAAFKILAASVGLVVGMIVNESLVVLEGIPFGGEIKLFISGLVSGIVILCLNYFIEHSEIMQKFWAYLDSFKSKYERALDYFKEINAELDRYVLELTQLEFNLDTDQMRDFSNKLSLATDELERNLVLKQEIDKQSIQLPFEMGNVGSSKSWLLNLAKNQ